MISLTESFLTNQCEGNASTLYGLPTVFFRLGVGCTLTCKGFGVPVIKDGVHLKDKDGNLLYGCDSYDSVYPQFKDRATLYNAEQLIEKYYELIPKLSYKNLSKPTITISGGEPSLFLKDKELQKFIAYFVSRDIPVLMETNGTVMIDFSIPHLDKVIYSISPKLSCNGDPFEKRIKIDALENIINNAKHSYLKFVVSEDGFYNGKDGNLSEWDEIRYILNNIPSYVKHVMFMGMGGELNEQYHRNQKFAYERALELGFGYSPRTHIDLYSDEKYK